MLDLLFVNTSQRVVDHGWSYSSCLEQPLSCLLCTQSRCHKISPRTIEYRLYKSFDTKAFNQDLASVPWHFVENENNIDDAMLTWKKLFSEIADAQAPLKKRRVKGEPVPWMNDKIRAAMRDRDYHHRKAVK